MVAAVDLVFAHLCCEAACDVEAWPLYWALTRIWENPADIRNVVCLLVL